MERYASIERPEQIETSGVTGEMSRPQRRPTSVSATPGAGRSSTSQAQPAANSGYVPPPTDEELAELDGAGDKTQIVDSSIAMNPGPQASSKNVLVDDSLTGETEYPEDATLPPTSREKVRANGRQQVVIGNEAEGYAGATVIGPAPTSRPVPEAREESNATRVGQIESGGTMVSPMLTGQRRRLDVEEEHEPEPSPSLDAEQESSDAYGDEAQEQPPDADLEEEESTGPIALQQQEPKPAAEKSKPAPQKAPQKEKAPRAAAGKKPPPKVLIGVAAGAVLLVVLVLGFVMLSGPRTGSLMVSVQTEGAELRVDGKPIKKNEVIELPVGSHKLTATAPGHLPLEQVVTVAKGQPPRVVSVALEAEPPADQPDKPAAQDSHVASTGTGTGTQAATQGSAPAQQAPVQTASTGTGTGTTATGTGTGPSTPPAPEAPPKPTTFAAVFVGEPGGTEVEVDGKSAGKTPNAKLANLTIGKTYSFTARRSGYKSYTHTFRSDGETEVKVPFELEKEEPPPPPPEHQAVKSAPVRSTPKPAPSPPKATVKGKLACSTKPPGAQIWVDGKSTGRETPVALGNPLLLPVGSRTVVFKIGGKQSKPQKVNITEGDVAKLINIPIE